MKCLVQRVNYAICRTNNTEISRINKGLLVFASYTHTDTEDNNIKMAKKLANLRIFEDDQGKMNKSLLDLNLEILIISQFTLYGDTNSGNRPSFTNCLDPNEANELYEDFLKRFEEYNLIPKHGKFRTDMQIELENDGPCTFELKI